MLIFLSVALFIYASMHLYAFGKVWLAFPPHSFGFALTLTLAGILLTSSPLIVWFLERQSWHRATVVTAWVSYTWMGFLFLFICIGLLFDLAHALARLFDLKWPLNDIVSLRTKGLLALALLGYGFIEAQLLQVEKFDIATPKLAAGHITIAQISDLHLGIMQGDGAIDRIVDKLRELKPDIVVATGDIVDGQGDDFEGMSSHFRAYTPPLGAYAVIGNHETYAGLKDSLRFLRNSGFTVLRGGSVRTGGIVLTGIDDPSVMSSGQQARPDTKPALASTTPDDFIVLLKHQPEVDNYTPFDLQLSGHIHGGQIFPFVYLTQLTYHVHTGLTELANGQRLYVSRGAGTWGPPIRLFAPPEITLITIASTNK
ncbi:metallophosphoesterase [Sideroxydans lithotrophicus]|uniref:Metallophosphoesterase n=1 Tax=Sideroxydans lithotrophicus (strain ES-1) TaxID=580332 RepID=D5CUK2_SIDLE|nr:metallophosphoesterase [Sideroxydans lithotrophicus]ADE12389.1 metallophosphoesterase [Sideroxydans lithotrophicus ES-1]